MNNTILSSRVKKREKLFSNPLRFYSIISPAYLSLSDNAFNHHPFIERTKKKRRRLLWIPERTKVTGLTGIIQSQGTSEYSKIIKIPCCSRVARCVIKRRDEKRGQQKARAARFIQIKRERVERIHPGRAIKIRRMAFGECRVYSVLWLQARGSARTYLTTDHRQQRHTNDARGGVHHPKLVAACAFVPRVLLSRQFTSVYLLIPTKCSYTS